VTASGNCTLCDWAAPGVGKSLLAQALAHKACRRGYEVLFVNTDKKLVDLAGGRADGTREQRLAHYTRADLLVLDDFGLKPLRAPGPEVSTTRSTNDMNAARSC
jgi:DNA replication protein DnaC